MHSIAKHLEQLRRNREHKQAGILEDAIIAECWTEGRLHEANISVDSQCMCQRCGKALETSRHRY